MRNEISIYGKCHVPGGLAGVYMYVTGAGEVGTNSVSANSLCIAAKKRMACKPPPVQGAMPYKEIWPTSL